MSSTLKERYADWTMKIRSGQIREEAIRRSKESEGNLTEAMKEHIWIYLNMECIIRHDDILNPDVKEVLNEELEDLISLDKFLG